MNNFRILIFIFLLVSVASLQAQTLHFILVADTQNSEAGFAESCKADSMNMLQEAGEMARGVGYNLKTYITSGRNFTPENLLVKVGSVAAKPNDVVFFYASCHAACRESDPPAVRDKQRWLSFPHDRSLGTDTLLSIIKHKNARLNILLVDACGKVRNLPPFVRKRGEAERKAYRALFSACGTVRAFSSRCAQFSYGDAKGGLFTNALLDALDHFINIEDGNISWEILLNYAAITTMQHAKQVFLQQQPVFFFDADFQEKCKP